MIDKNEFSTRSKQGLYDAIFLRRDVRRDFLPRPINQEALARIIQAAHHAPSVGFMQPWNFIFVDDQEIKAKVKQAFDKANQHAETLFDKEKAKKYSSLKLEGILESPLNLCITCDSSRNGPVVLGTTSQENMDRYSTVCAIQNLWLAARTEGIGCGWVSIIDENDLKEILHIPTHIDVIAYLCLGYVKEFAEKPDLEEEGWLSRLNPAELISFNSFDNTSHESFNSLKNSLRFGTNIK